MQRLKSRITFFLVTPLFMGLAAYGVHLRRQYAEAEAARIYYEREDKIRQARVSRFRVDLQMPTPDPSGFNRYSKSSENLGEGAIWNHRFVNSSKLKGINDKFRDVVGLYSQVTIYAPPATSDQQLEQWCSEIKSIDDPEHDVAVAFIIGTSSRSPNNKVAGCHEGKMIRTDGKILTNLKNF